MVTSASLNIGGFVQIEAGFEISGTRVRSRVDASSSARALGASTAPPTRQHGACCSPASRPVPQGRRHDLFLYVVGSFSLVGLPGITFNVTIRTDRALHRRHRRRRSTTPPAPSTRSRPATRSRSTAARRSRSAPSAFARLGRPSPSAGSRSTNANVVIEQHEGTFTVGIGGASIALGPVSLTNVNGIVVATSAGVAGSLAASGSLGMRRLQDYCFDNATHRRRHQHRHGAGRSLARAAHAHCHATSPARPRWRRSRPTPPHGLAVGDKVTLTGVGSGYDTVAAVVRLGDTQRRSRSATSVPTMPPTPPRGTGRGWCSPSTFPPGRTCGSSSHAATRPTRWRCHGRTRAADRGRVRDRVVGTNLRVAISNAGLRMKAGTLDVLTVTDADGFVVINDGRRRRQGERHRHPRRARSHADRHLRDPGQHQHRRRRLPRHVRRRRPQRSTSI